MQTFTESVPNHVLNDCTLATVCFLCGSELRLGVCKQHPFGVQIIVPKRGG